MQTLFRGFVTTHSVNIVNKRIPQNVQWIDSGVYFVSQPRRNNHLGHFIEGINQALLVLRFPSLYPKFTNWYIPKFGYKEFEWTKIYLRLLHNLFPDDFKPTSSRKMAHKARKFFRTFFCHFYSRPPFFYLVSFLGHFLPGNLDGHGA